MKYAVAIIEEDEDNAKPQVLFESGFHWCARLIGAIWSLHRDDVTIIQVDDSAQSIIDRHFDAQALVEELDRLGGVHQAVYALNGLVARNDAGKWTTVHDADTELDEATGAYLDRVLV